MEGKDEKERERVEDEENCGKSLRKKSKNRENSIIKKREKEGSNDNGI